VLQQLIDFHREHATAMAQVMADRDAAAGQIPRAQHRAESDPPVAAPTPSRRACSARVPAGTQPKQRGEWRTMYRMSHAELVSRRGVILLVVLAMLTLFAIVGLSFVLYADAETRAAQVFRDAQSSRQPDVEPELAFSYFLGQLLYDCLDDESGVYSALRGHSLLRNLYGLNAEYDPATGSWALGNNYVGYNGPGRLHTDANTCLNPWGLDDYSLVNYTYFPGDGFLRDPERYAREGATRWRASPRDPRGPYVGHNVSYTYPDLNNLFLAAVKADGTVLVPSFHRPRLFGSLDRSNPNWKSSNPQGKYLILRPRPEDHARDAAGNTLFPYPEDATGDVKNLIGSPGGNDSLWIDLDFPVLTAPDGRRYKPLFAPLIMDLDGRVNVNVHGNTLGTNSEHRSNHGLGPWEVNLGKVLNADRDEWKNLLLGKPAAGAPVWRGRLGTDRQPGNGGPLPDPHPTAGPLYRPHPYAPVDFDGRDEATGAATGRMRVPAAAPAGNPVLPFPAFPPTGYGNASLRERTGHPLLSNPLEPAASDPNNDDRPFAHSNLSALLLSLDTGGPALTSELLRLCPLNLSNPGDLAGSPRRGRMLTTLSVDLDRPGVAPWLWNPSGLDAAYKYDATRGYPIGGPIPFPGPALGGRPPETGNPFTNSEFSRSGWQAVSPAPDMSRLNLYRPLRPYPAPDPNTGRIVDTAAFLAAQQDRQDLAADIFKRLWKLTGAPDPDTPGLNPNSDEFRALRWLAQLAVNVVDYIDPDDYMTPFNWRKDPAPQWVFGTELPRLVLNEAYVQKHAEGTGQRVTAWVELLNPLSPSPTLTNNGDAVLQIGTNPVYQVVLAGKDPNLRAPENVAGGMHPRQIKAAVRAWSDPSTRVVKPSDGRYASTRTDGTEGFYVLGPAGVPFPTGADPQLPATFLSPGMTYTTAAARPPTILLRRLACPHLPPNPFPGSPLYNPYITVDYMEDVPVNTAGAADRASHGRNQPYAGHVSQRVAQNPAAAGQPGQPRHTFFRHNAREDAGPPSPTAANQTLKVPFDWLVHLDRPPVSPAELLHVSGYKPHELTQQFVAPTAADPSRIAPFQHYAAWGQPEARISRLFGFLETRPPLFDGLYDTPPNPPDSRSDSAPGRRVPGRINLNTIWDEEIFQALCDAGPSNGFTADDVRAAFRRLVAYRMPNATDPLANPVLDGTDRPLLDPSTGYTAPGDRQYPNGASVHNTVLRPGLFDLPDPDPTTGKPRHPYQKLELLSKIYNNTTVRSNVFAV
jgi:hypothetical protein